MKPTLDLNNTNVKLIIGALVGMVEDDGFTPREAFQIVEEIKKQTYFALMDIDKGKF